MYDPAPEYEVLDSALDQLDTLLDHLEQKNDDLFTKLQDLLESNKETRAERQTVHTETGDSTDRGTSDGTGRDTSDGSDEHRPAEH